MIVLRRRVGLALIVMVLLLTACGVSAKTAEPVVTGAPSAEASTGSEDHEGEDADAHEGEDTDTHDASPEDTHNVEGLPELEAVKLADGERLRVVATTSIVGDVVAQVGGDTIDLTVLLALGEDPHAYQPSAQDLATAAQAHLIFVNGFDLEENLLQDLESAAEGVPIVPVSAGIEPLDGKAHGDDEEHKDEEHKDEGEDREDEQHEDESEEEHEDEEHDHAQDPHVWFNASHVETWTHNIEQLLSALDPANAETYTSNAKAYEEELEALDEFVRETLNTIPEENHKLVTNHDSFGYLAEEYGLEIIGTVIPNLSTNAEPSASDLSQLIETIKQEQVPAIFIDSGVSNEFAQVVVDETGVALFALYSGALGAEGSGADSYLDMMRTNVERIEEGLGTE